MIHIAVLLQPYIDLILQGKKTIESRLTQDARVPFEGIEPGERIYFKKSAGPYGATAIAEHVLCESDLTPKRIDEIRRLYNDQICGDAAYWNWKRTARYCTLIWLRDVIAIDNGPEIRPLQGVAWVTLDEDPAWRKWRAPSAAARSRSPATAAASPPSSGNRSLQSVQETSSFAIEITPGNLRNNSLYVTSALHRFPASCKGGTTRAQGATEKITLLLHDGPTVHTDIVAPRNMLRTRVWGRWFKRHDAKPGDHVVFTPLDEFTYMVGLSRRRAPSG